MDGHIRAFMDELVASLTWGPQWEKIMFKNLCQGFIYILHRDLLLAFRHVASLANPLIFFIIVVSLFPLTIIPDAKLLHTLGPGVIWVVALLAMLLGLERLFHDDFFDGTLEQLLLSVYPLPLLVLAKVIAYWLTTGLPLLLISPVLGLLFHLSPDEIGMLFLSLALATPILSVIGAIGAALTVGLRGGGILLALLILPLNIPILIFGVGGQLALLAAILSLVFTLGPIAIAAAIRVGLEYEH